jgi:two-component system sensor histidine kinase KdpD
MLAGVLPVLATLALYPFREQTGLDTELLVFLLVTVAVGALGGTLPALASSLLGFLLANWFFTPPVGSLTITEPANLFTLLVFVVVAGAVGGLVGLASRRSAEARRARREAEALATLAGSITVDQDALDDLVRQVRATFELEAASVLHWSDERWEVVASAGDLAPSNPDEASEVLDLGGDTKLALLGSRLGADDWIVLHAFTAQLAAALETRKLHVEAATAHSMAETDKLRSALLNAVSHDLRTPLAGIKASVTSLLETGVEWSPEQIEGFHRAILDETEKLNSLVGKLLDASRIQTGAVHVFFRVVGLEEVVAAAVTGLAQEGSRLEIDVPESLPGVQTDPALLERVVANLVENALAWSPPGQPVQVRAGEVAGRVDLRISDRGPGISDDDRERMFQPFQRLGDTPKGTGVGLGLAVARGLVEAMGHELIVEDTPGGGTTMVVGMKAAL